MSLENDAYTYVLALRSPANGWGQHLIEGQQSHVWLGKMFERYGKDKVNNYLEDNYWSNPNEPSMQ